MPQTPATWLDSFSVSEDEFGSESQGQVVQLANGNILVAWTVSTFNGIGSPPDVLGRIFDSSGHPVTGDFLLNQAFFSRFEGFPAITALPNGGFVVAYRSFNDTGPVHQIRLEAFSSTGQSVGSQLVADDAPAGTAQANPVIAGSSSTSNLVVWERTTAGVGELYGRVYNAANNTMGSEFLILSASIGDLEEPDIAVLGNGNYAVVASVATGDRGLVMRILDPAGGNVLGFTEVAGTRSNGTTDSDASIAALEGGGFVVSWRKLDSGGPGLVFQRFDANGVAQGGAVSVSSSAGNNNFDPEIAPLADGGFVLVYRGANAIPAIVAQRYSSTGVAVGSEMIVRETANSIQFSDHEVTPLADGRIAISYSVNQDVFLEILDTRDAGLSFGERFYGTVGADVILGADPDVFGGAGDDVITEGSASLIDGGDGNDLVNVQTTIGSSDVYRGGVGTDTIDWSRVSDGRAVFDLQDGIAVQTQNNLTEVMVGFENLIGMAAADTILGTTGANELSGLGGDDLIDGRGGADRIFGGDGVDTLNGGDGNDTLVGNTQIFVRERDILNGGNGDDVIFAEGVDVINGGAGIDSLIAINSFDFNLDMAAASIEYAVMDFGNDVITATSQSVRVDVFGSGGNDIVVGSSFNDLLFGGSGADTILGGAGNDAIVGEVGIDNLSGGEGDDRIYFDAQDSFVSGGAGYDAGYITPGTGAGAVIDLGAASLEFIQDLAGAGDTILGSTATQGLSIYGGGGADTVDGSAFADVVFGEAGADILNGNAGSDVLVGGSGADRLRGGTGNDALYGGAADGAADAFVFQHSGAANSDAVYDFVIGQDKIDLSAFGAAFAGVGIVTAAGSSVVYLNGQVVCTVVGVTGLTAGDFVMSGGGAPVAPGDEGSPKVEAALVLPGEIDPSVVRPEIMDVFWRPAWTTDLSGGWLTMLV